MIEGRNLISATPSGPLSDQQEDRVVMLDELGDPLGEQADLGHRL